MQEEKTVKKRCKMCGRVTTTTESNKFPLCEDCKERSIHQILHNWLK